jgi:uncharacterized SAM-binding protein YcdF (DUF218 family)
LFWTIISAALLITVLTTISGYFFLPRILWNFLVVDEEPQPADVIIVLSGGIDRVTHGVNLFKSGYADRILFSGSVARNMSRQARIQGVPEDRMLLEEESGTTNGNAEYSYKIVQSQGFRSAIVVTSAFHTRRSSIIFRHIFRGVDVTVSAAPYDPSLVGNWWKDERMARAVLSEYPKLIYHYFFER